MHFSQFDLELWPTTLAYNPSLAKVKVNSHARNQGHRSNSSSRRAHTSKRTDGRMGGRYQTYYLPCFAVDNNTYKISQIGDSSFSHVSSHTHQIVRMMTTKTPSKTIFRPHLQSLWYFGFILAMVLFIVHPPPYKTRLLEWLQGAWKSKDCNKMPH